MLQEQLQKDLTDSLKSGETLKRSVIGMVVSSIRNRSIEKRTRLSKSGTPEAELEKTSQLTDEEILEVIASEVKKRKESVTQFRAGNREELAKKEEDEIAILMRYLPEQMSEEAVRMEAQAVIAELGAHDMKDMGKVISALMAKFKGKADGGMVSKIVKELLS